MSPGESLRCSAWRSWLIHPEARTAFPPSHLSSCHLLYSSCIFFSQRISQPHDQRFPIVGGGPARCRMVSAALSLCPLESRRTLTAVGNQKCLQTLPVPSWGQKRPQLGTLVHMTRQEGMKTQILHLRGENHSSHLPIKNTIIKGQGI